MFGRAGALRAGLNARGWPVATAPGPMLAHLFAGEILTAVLFGVALANANWSDHAFTMAVVFTLMAIFFEECVAHAARLEMRLTHNLRRDMTSVWTVASAVVLPPAYAALVVTGVSLHIWFRQHRPIGRPLYRTVYNISNYVLATMCADVVVHYFASAWAALPLAVGGAISVLVAIGVYTLVNRLLISTALMLVGVSVKDLRGTRDENLIELATLCLGGLVAVVALHQPWLCLLVLAPMVTLQRGALVAELETAATTDAKTGLLNAVAWEHLTQRELARAARENYDVAILIIDIDRFKLVNDQYGHLVGDHVLRKIGKVLAAEVREYDTVGRFGGEEFVAVLPNAGDADALVVAERLRSRVNELCIAAMLDGPAPEGAAEHVLAISVGVSCSSFDGIEVPELLVAADAALYRAKAGGRNRVVLAERGTGPGAAVLQD